MTRIYLYPDVWDPQLRERLRVPVSHVDAIALAGCSKCGAETGVPCSYYWTAYGSDILEQSMEQTHPERRDVVFDARVRVARRLEWRRLQLWLLTHVNIFREDEG